MLPLVKTLNLDGTPLTIVSEGNELILIDNSYTFYYLDKEHLTLTNTKKISGISEKLHAYHKGFMGHGQTVHLPLHTAGTSALIGVGETVVKKATLAWHSANVEAAAFSPDGTYVATGGQDGRVYIHDVASGKLVASLPARPDSVSALKFSSCGKRLAAATFDKRLVIFDIDRNIPIAKFKTETVVEAMVFFGEDDHKLFAVCREGHSAVFSFPLGEKESQVNKKNFHDWPSVLEKSRDGRIVIVASRQSNLYFIRLDDNTVIHEMYLFKKGVTLLRLVENLLFIGYDDGTMEVMKIDRDLKEFKVALHIKDYEEARRLLVSQPFLMVHPAFKQFDDAWEKVKNEARELIINRNIDQARKRVQPFMFDPGYQKEFDTLMGRKNIIIRFLDAVKYKDYPTAYALASKNSEILGLQAYEDLESHWLKTMKKVRSLIGQGGGENRHHIDHLLSPFSKVPEKKAVIDSLLNNHAICIDAKQLIMHKDFAAFFRLADEHLFLKEGDLYRNIFPMIEKVFTQANTLEEKSRYSEALELMEVIREIGPFTERAGETIARIKEKQELMTAIKNKNLVDGYKLVEFSPKLSKSPEFKTFQQRFEKATEQALTQAFNGRTADVLDLYEEFLAVDYLQYKIAAVAKVACLYEIRSALGAKQKVNWPQTIKEYVERFGKDGEITRICSKGKLKEILDAQPQFMPYNGYLKYGLPDSILVTAS